MDSIHRADRDHSLPMIQEVLDVDVHLITSDLFTRDGRGHVKLNTIPQHREALKRARQRREVGLLHWCRLESSKKTLEMVFSSLMAPQYPETGICDFRQGDNWELLQASTDATSTGSSQFYDSVNYESDGLKVSAGALDYQLDDYHVDT